MTLGFYTNAVHAETGPLSNAKKFIEVVKYFDQLEKNHTHTSASLFDALKNFGLISNAKADVGDACIIAGNSDGTLKGNGRCFKDGVVTLDGNKKPKSITCNKDLFGPLVIPYPKNDFQWTLDCANALLKKATGNKNATVTSMDEADYGKLNDYLVNHGVDMDKFIAKDGSGQIDQLCAVALSSGKKQDHDDCELLRKSLGDCHGNKACETKKAATEKLGSSENSVKEPPTPTPYPHADVVEVPLSEPKLFKSEPVVCPAPQALSDAEIQSLIPAAQAVKREVNKDEDALFKFNPAHHLACQVRGANGVLDAGDGTGMTRWEYWEELKRLGEQTKTAGERYKKKCYERDFKEKAAERISDSLKDMDLKAKPVAIDFRLNHCNIHVEYLADKSDPKQCEQTVDGKTVFSCVKVTMTDPTIWGGDGDDPETFYDEYADNTKALGNHQGKYYKDGDSDPTTAKTGPFNSKKYFKDLFYGEHRFLFGRKPTPSENILQRGDADDLALKSHLVDTMTNKAYDHCSVSNSDNRDVVNGLLRKPATGAVAPAK